VTEAGWLWMFNDDDVVVVVIIIVVVVVTLAPSFPRHIDATIAIKTPAPQPPLPPRPAVAMPS